MTKETKTKGQTTETPKYVKGYNSFSKRLF